MEKAKIIHPFDVKIGGKYWPVFVKITLGGQPYRNDEGYFSMSGVEGPLQTGNAKGSCGQIDMGYEHRSKQDNDKRYSELKKCHELRFAKGWTKDMWLDILDAWKRWHLKNIEEVPAHVTDFIGNLPNTDRRPNWV